MEESASLKMWIMWMNRLVYSPLWLIRLRTPIHKKGLPKSGDANRCKIKGGKKGEREREGQRGGGERMRDILQIKWYLLQMGLEKLINNNIYSDNLSSFHCTLRVDIPSESQFSNKLVLKILEKLITLTK